MADESSRRILSFPWLVAWLALVLLFVATTVSGRPDRSLLAVKTPAAASDSSSSGVAPSADASPRFATTIRRPLGPPVIELGRADPHGRVGAVACSTCHSVREPDETNRTPADLDQFHQNMPMAHGELACYACHNPSDADTLKLADSTAVEYADVMTLCAQCHGPQAKDYEHGAHGGMNGYWDLSRGPRTRNNCIDCHDPHVPKFPKMQPTFKPHDRFLESASPHRSVSPIHHSDSEVDGE